MRCIDFQDRWQDLLDARQNPSWDTKLCEHAAECESCAVWLDDSDTIFSRFTPHRLALRSLEGPEDVADDFAEQTVARSCREQARSQRWARYGTLAAGLALSLLGMSWLPGVVAPRLHGLHSHSQPLHVSPSLVNQTWDSLPVEPSRTSAESLKAVPVQIASLEVTAWVRDWFRQATVEGRLRLEPVEELAESFEPLASSFQTALLVIRNSLPLRRNESSMPSGEREPMEASSGGNYDGKLHSFG
jgi:hypothetical protein